jgi:pimeloyl-ACP methyl ester carboxylesterase
MSTIAVNGIRINYSDDKPANASPSIPAVLLIMGSGGNARAWHLHQVPALVEAGLRVVTFDNRGVPPSDECPGGFSIADMVADTAALIEALDLAPCAVVGTSMGAQIAQELAVSRPDLVRRLVLMATRARSDVLRTELARAELELFDKGVELPAVYDAVVRAMRNLSPYTLNDEQRVRDWLDVLELTSSPGPSHRFHLAVSVMPDRRAAYGQIKAPTRVIAFEDDLICPPNLNREVADAIPGAQFQLMTRAGHFGYLEAPEMVNRSIVKFVLS